MHLFDHSVYNIIMCRYVYYTVHCLDPDVCTCTCLLCVCVCVTIQVTHLARLLASQMTSAGIGVGAIAKGIKPQTHQVHVCMVCPPSLCESA